VDADGRILAVNRTATELLGYRDAELIGEPVEVLVPEADRESHAAHVRAFAEGSVARRMMSDRPVLAARRKDGTEIPVDVTISKVIVDGRIVMTAFLRAFELRQNEESLRARERRLRALLGHSAEAVNVVTPDGTLRWVSDAAPRIFGYREGDPIPAPPIRLADFSHPQDRDLLQKKLAEAVARPGVPIEWESRVRMFDGSYRWFASTATSLLDDPIVAGIVINARDVHALHEHAAREARLSRLTRFALGDVGVERVIDEARAALADMLGADVVVMGRVSRAGGLEGRLVEAPRFEAQPFRSVPPTPFWEGVLGARRPLVWHAVGSAPVPELAGSGVVSGIATPLVSGGEPVGALGVFTRVARNWSDADTAFVEVCGSVVSTVLERARAQADLVRQSLHDPLTGLPNRALLTDRAHQALVRQRRQGSSVALLLADLDDFKTVNDSLGHAAGDELLRIASERITSTLRSTDTLARFGGDEFVILCEDPAGHEEAAIAVAQRILEVMRAPFTIHAREVYATASIGIATAGGETPEGLEELLANADLAMYQAKRRGGDGAVIFDEALRGNIQRRLDLARDLRRALEADQFDVAYQPKIELATGRVAAVEALVRWRHPRDGVKDAETFMRTAEEIGLVVDLGAVVMRKAFDQARRWDQRFAEDAPQRTFVNVSRRELLHPGFLDRFTATMRHTPVRGDLLGVEITEHAFLEDLDGAREVLQALRDLGVQVCIDDFGTGYSSLTYLQRLPVDWLKIDKSFVAHLDDDEPTRRIVRAIVDMAHDLGLRVTAEGVDTPAKVEIARDLGCDEAQGYHCGRPGPPDEIDRLLAAQTRRGDS